MTKERFANIVDRVICSRQSFQKGGKYRVIKSGASLSTSIPMEGSAVRYKTTYLPVGAIIEYVGEVTGFGHDNVKEDTFAYGDIRGAFSPEYWGMVKDGWLEEV